MTIITIDTENVDNTILAALASFIIKEAPELDYDLARVLHDTLEIHHALYEAPEWCCLFEIEIPDVRRDVIAQGVELNQSKLIIKAEYGYTILHIQQWVDGKRDQPGANVAILQEDAFIIHNQNAAWIKAMEYFHQAVADFKALPETAPDPVTEAK